jgi:hypothetical protein
LDQNEETIDADLGATITGTPTSSKNGRAILSPRLVET